MSVKIMMPQSDEGAEHHEFCDSDNELDFTFRSSSPAQPTQPAQRASGRRSALVHTLSQLYRPHHPRVLDHYSLPTPSSTVRFRSANVHVYDSQGSQLIMEERLTTRKSSRTIASLQLQGADPAKTTTSNVTVKRVVYSSPELLFLRAMYAAITFFMGSFLFIFAVGLLLFLISDLANQARDIIVYGARDKGDIVFPFIGTILSTPVFIQGLTQVMTLVTSFVADTFSGSPLLHSFGYGRVMTNWIKFIFFIGIPAIAFAVLLFTASANVLALTLETTFISVTTFFVCFSTIVIFLRLSACLYLIQELYYDKENMTIFEKLKYVLLTAEESALSGKKHNNYIYYSDLYNMKQFDAKSTVGSEDSGKPYKYFSQGKWYIKFTQLLPRLFVTLDSPTRCWTQSEIDFNIPFYTRNSWSLESVFCRQKKSSLITMVSGQSAVTHQQSISSLTCYMFGVLFYILLVAGVMVYFHVSSSVMATVICILIAYWAWQGRKELELLKSINEILRNVNEADNDDEHDLALFQKWETYTITKPKPTFAWIYFFMKNFVIAIIPFAYFCHARNVVGAMMYLMFFALCFEKNYLDIGPIVETLGSFGTLGMESGSKLTHDGLLGARTREEWRRKSRLYHITRMNNVSSRSIWAKLMNFFAFIFALTATAAIASGSGQEEGAEPYTTFPSNNTFFYDEPQEEMSPICRSDFSDNEGSTSTGPMKYLADYNFLSIIPYFRADSIQPVLDTWFGKGEAILDQNVIPSFREAHPELPSSASFQLVTFSDGSAVVCVRGTKTYFDFLVDARLWYAASLFQFVQSAMPFGFAVDALIQFCVDILSNLETESVKKVSYYVETTAFVDFLQESGNYTKVELTGHSLGGGLALITGAQTKTRAIGISAPSSVMTRSAVTPEISLEDIKRYSFTLVPQRDLVSHLGGKHENMNKVTCRTDVKDSFSCHLAYRSLCELLYSCGRKVKRPVYCECLNFGYPDPNASDKSGTSFETSCQNL